jgi:hypothetical protein
MTDRDSDSGTSRDQRREESGFKEQVESELAKRRQDLDKRLAEPLERLERIAKRSRERF